MPTHLGQDLNMLSLPLERRAVGSAPDLPAPTTYWNMNSAAGQPEVDVVGGLVLTPTNGVGSVAGKIGGARSFASASSQFLSTPDTAALRLNVASTIAAWVNFYIPNTNMCLLAKQVTNVAANQEYQIYKSTVATVIAYIQGPSTGISDSFGTAIYSQWTCVCAQWNGTNLFGALNGGAFVNQAAPYLPQSVGGTFFVGSRASDSPIYMDGAVDSIAIWKGTLLTPAQWQNFYNGGAGREYRGGAWTL